MKEKDLQEQLTILNKKIHGFYKKRFGGLSIEDYTKVTGMLLRKYVLMVRRAAKTFAKCDLKEEQIFPKMTRVPIVDALERCGCVPILPMVISPEILTPKERYCHFKFMVYELSPDAMNMQTESRKAWIRKGLDSVDSKLKEFYEEELEEFNGLLDKGTIQSQRQVFYDMCFDDENKLIDKEDEGDFLSQVIQVIGLSDSPERDLEELNAIR